MNVILPWNPNEILNETKMIMDWRSRCTPFPSFEEVENVMKDNLSTIGASLFHTTNGSMELSSVNTSNIHSTSFPLFPLEESQRGDSFTY